MRRARARVVRQKLPPPVLKGERFTQTGRACGPGKGLGMRILITGGAGYVGTVLAEQLLARGHRVRCLDNLLYGRDPLRPLLQGRRFEFCEGSVEDGSLVRSALQGCTAVVHLAGLANDGSCDRDPGRARRVNVQAAADLAARARAAGCERLINASSCSVYGYSDGNALTEAARPKPVSLYGVLKLEAEAAIDAAGGPDLIVAHLRQATLFGPSPRMRWDLAVNAMTRDACLRGRIQVHGGGLQWRPFLHVHDAAAAFVAALDAPPGALVGRVFNVGSGAENYRIADLAALVQTAVPSARIERPTGAVDRRSYRVDFRRVGGALDWRPWYTVRQGIAEIRALLQMAPAALP